MLASLSATEGKQDLDWPSVRAFTLAWEISPPNRAIGGRRQQQEKSPVSLINGCSSDAFNALHDHLSLFGADGPFPNFALPVHTYLKKRKVTRLLHRSDCSLVSIGSDSYHTAEG